MPIGAQIDLSEWEEMQAKLLAMLQKDRMDIIEQAARVALTALDEYARNIYPPTPRPLPQAQNWTARQRRWWWGTMHRKAQGLAPYALPGWTAEYRLVPGVRKPQIKKLFISGSYRRTGTLVKSLAPDIKRLGEYVRAEYGTNVPYASYVIDRKNQADYHKGNWRTLQVLVRAFTPELKRVFGEEVVKLVRQKLEVK